MGGTSRRPDMPYLCLYPLREMFTLRLGVSASSGSFHRAFGDLLRHLVLEIHPKHQTCLRFERGQHAEHQTDDGIEAELQIRPHLMEEAPVLWHRRIDASLDQDQRGDVEKRDVDRDEGVKGQTAGSR